MKHFTLDVIRDEHHALSAMLRSLSMLLGQARREGRMPDFDVLRAMLFYIDEFPERLHHTKESALLFPRLRERAPELAEVLDRMDRDHAAGEKAIRDLEHSLLAFEVMGESRRAAFEQAASTCSTWRSRRTTCCRRHAGCSPMPTGPSWTPPLPPTATP